MPYVFPPESLPLPLVAASSSKGAAVPHRVCDDCYSLVMGQRRPSASALSASGIVTSPASSLPALSSSLSSQSASSSSSRGDTRVCRPKALSSPQRPKLSRSATAPLIPGSPASSTAPPRRRRNPTTVRSSSPTPSSSSTSRTQPTDLGVLESYPLKMSSQGCKITGAAVWSPRTTSIRIELRQQSETRNIRISSLCDDDDDDDESPALRRGVVVHGEIQLRTPIEPKSLRTGGPNWSTF